MLRSLLPISVWLIAAYGWAASEADRAVIQLMRVQSDGAQQVRILHRAAVDPELDMVVALSGPDEGWWNTRSKLGLFLQRREEPGLRYKIAVEHGRGDADCYARVERATATDVVISCTPEKGRPGPNRKFVYDVRAKVLVKQVVYDQFAMYRVFGSEQKAVLVGSDSHRVIAIEYRPAQEPAFRLLSGAQAESWTRRVPFTTGTIGVGAEQRRELYPEPKKPKPVHFGPGNRFTLLDGSVQLMNEQIGPYQIADGTLWFAKTFYDGEGMTGVGGFGYFDTQTGEYRIYSPVEIKDWSATAMLVESDAIWIGLAHNGEWGATGGGILQFDRSTQKATRLPLQEIVGEITRVGDQLVMATSFGAALFDGVKLRRFFVDETTDGRLHVAEALPVPVK